MPDSGSGGRGTNVTAEYLSRAIRAGRVIEALSERARRYGDLATRAAGRTAAAPAGGSGQRGPVDDNVCKPVDLAREMARRAGELADTVREIEAAIDRAEDGRLRELLRLRYLNGWRWERIADALGVEDRRWVFRLHGKALLAVEKEMEKEAPIPGRAPGGMTADKG